MILFSSILVALVYCFTSSFTHAIRNVAPFRFVQVDGTCKSENQVLNFLKQSEVQLKDDLNLVNVVDATGAADSTVLGRAFGTSIKQSEGMDRFL
jgi:hypothetical protein